MVKICAFIDVNIKGGLRLSYLLNRPLPIGGEKCIIF